MKVSVQSQHVHRLHGILPEYADDPRLCGRSLDLESIPGCLGLAFGLWFGCAIYFAGV